MNYVHHAHLIAYYNSKNLNLYTLFRKEKMKWLTMQLCTGLAHKYMIALIYRWSALCRNWKDFLLNIKLKT